MSEQQLRAYLDALERERSFNEARELPAERNEAVDAEIRRVKGLLGNEKPKRTTAPKRQPQTAEEKPKRLRLRKK